MDPKGVNCIILGYSKTQKGYKCYIPQLHKRFISVDVAFHESFSFNFAKDKEDHFPEVVTVFS